MKKSAYIVWCLATYKTKRATTDERVVWTRTSDKAIGWAIRAIHGMMGGEMYSIDPPTITEGSIIIVANGRRGGYPEQPSQIVIRIRKETPVG